MLTSALRERLDSGETVLGTFQLTDSPVVAEITGLAGLDFVVLDQEHGPLTAETCQGLVAAAETGGASPIVRVRENAAPEIQRALDIGAAGVQVPQIETAETARRAVEAARFSPIGQRGLSPYVRAGEYAGIEDFTARENERVVVSVHIEGERGVENVEEIMSVEGLDVAFLGPYDLSQSLGIPGQVHDERVERMMADVCERASDHDIAVGAYANDPAMAQCWIDAGVQYVTVAVDGALIHQSMAEVAEAIDA